MPGRGEGSSRAMLATARPSCYFTVEATVTKKNSKNSKIYGQTFKSVIRSSRVGLVGSVAVVL